MDEERFIKGDTSTSYLKEIWPDGFTGIPLSPAKKDHLTALAASIFVQDDIAAMELDTSRLRGTDELNRVWKVQVENGDDRRRAAVKRLAPGRYEVVVDEKTYKITLPLSLSQPTMAVEVEGDANYIVQVPARNFAGSIRISFEGTAFDLKVVTAQCAEYLQRMPERPKPDASKQVRGMVDLGQGRVEVKVIWVLTAVFWVGFVGHSADAWTRQVRGCRGWGCRGRKPGSLRR